MMNFRNVSNLFLLSSIAIASVDAHYLRRAVEQQQCNPVPTFDDSDDSPTTCVDSLFVLLDVQQEGSKTMMNDNDIQTAFMETYNQNVDCQQYGADRAIQSVEVLNNAVEDEENLSYNDNVSTNNTRFLLEISLKCNSCVHDMPQLFDGTHVGLPNDDDHPPIDANTCDCDGPNTNNFMESLEDNFNQNYNASVVNVTQIPLLYPDDDDDDDHHHHAGVDGCDAKSQTTYGNQGVCPGTKDDNFLCMFTQAPTYAPTTMEPTFNPTQFSCSDWADNVYIHSGCSKAGYATDADCKNGPCAFGEGYYCNDSTDIWVGKGFTGSFDNSKICNECDSGIQYDNDHQAWYCIDHWPW